MTISLFCLYPIIVYFIAAIFSAPARIPTLKRRGMTSSRWRWGLIGGLAVLPLLVQVLGLMWITPNIQSIFATISYSGIYVEPKDRNALITELRWRQFIFWDNDRCFTENADACALADSITDWNTSNTSSNLSQMLYMLLFLSPPAIATGFWAYRLTAVQEKTKPKRE